MRTFHQNLAGWVCCYTILEKFSHRHHSDLRPSFRYPKGIKLGSEECIKFLLEIANYSSPLHDGFIFFNENGLLTHVSQYFAPIIDDRKIVPNENYGTRYRAAQYGSLLKGVILTAIIPQNASRYIIFWKGREIEPREIEKVYSNNKGKLGKYLDELKRLIRWSYIL